MQPKHHKFIRYSRKVRFAHLPLVIQKSIVKNAILYYNFDSPFESEIIFEYLRKPRGDRLPFGIAENTFLRTADTGRTYSKLKFWESNFFAIINNSF